MADVEKAAVVTGVATVAAAWAVVAMVKVWGWRCPAALPPAPRPLTQGRKHRRPPRSPSRDAFVDASID